jgi:hypothetical protein
MIQSGNPKEIGKGLRQTLNTNSKDKKGRLITSFECCRLKRWFQSDIKLRRAQ